MPRKESVSSSPKTQPRERAELVSRIACGLTLLLTAVLSTPVNTQPPSRPSFPVLSADAYAIACGPRGAFGPPDRPMRVMGSQDGAEHITYDMHDSLVIDSGSDQGL